MTSEEKLTRIEHIATTARKVIGSYVNSRLALNAIIAVLNDEPDDWDLYELVP